MPFDPKKGLTLPQAAPKMRGRKGRPHIDTITRWIKVGCKLPSGEWVKLRAVKLGGVWYTSEEWVEVFENARLLGGLAL